MKPLDLPLSLPWSVLPGPLVFLDVETTGVGRSDQVIEVAAIRMGPGEAARGFQTLIDHGGRPVQASHIHRITGRMLDGAPGFEAVVPPLADLLEGATLVAHNASFERRMLAAELERLGGRWQVPTLCTYALARRAYPGRKGRGAHTLGSMVRINGLVMDGAAHAAWPDARVLPELLVALLARARNDTERRAWVHASVTAGGPTRWPAVPWSREGLKSR